MFFLGDITSRLFTELSFKMETNLDMIMKILLYNFSKWKSKVKNVKFLNIRF